MRLTTNVGIAEIQWLHRAVVDSHNNQRCRFHTVIPLQIKRHWWRHRRRDVIACVFGDVESESYSCWQRVGGTVVRHQHRLNRQTDRQHCFMLHILSTWEAGTNWTTVGERLYSSSQLGRYLCLFILKYVVITSKYIHVGQQKVHWHQLTSWSRTTISSWWSDEWSSVDSLLVWLWSLDGVVTVLLASPVATRNLN